MTIGRWVLAGFASLIAGGASASEFTAYADVVSVEPVVVQESTVRRADGCHDRPPVTAGLTATLAWDLVALNCRTQDHQTRVVGYRVTYRWDGHDYQQTLPEDPGAVLPVSVSVR